MSKYFVSVVTDRPLCGVDPEFGNYSPSAHVAVRKCGRLDKPIGKDLALVCVWDHDNPMGEDVPYLMRGSVSQEAWEAFKDCLGKAMKKSKSKTVRSGWLDFIEELGGFVFETDDIKLGTKLISGKQIRDKYWPNWREELALM